MSLITLLRGQTCFLCGQLRRSLNSSCVCTLHALYTHFLRSQVLQTPDTSEVIPGEAPQRLSITVVNTRLANRTAHICALNQGRAASCQECLLQAVMAHSRLLKHREYTPLQLLFGHESAPIAGETFDDEQQGRSSTESMAERLARQQSVMMA